MRSWHYRAMRPRYEVRHVENREPALARDVAGERCEIAALKKDGADVALARKRLGDLIESLVAQTRGIELDLLCEHSVEFRASLHLLER